MIAEALPTLEQIFASSSPWFSTMVDEFMPFVYISLGIAVGSFLLWWLVKLFERGFAKLTGRYHEEEEEARWRELDMWKQQELDDARRWGGWRGGRHR